MTTFLLIRHGLTDAVGQRLTGRLPGLHLNDIGRTQATGLPERLSRWRIDAIYSSPLERAVETATPFSERSGLPILTDIAFAEFDYGRWSGKPIGELEQTEEWRRFVRLRSCSPAPGGELITEVQTRIVTALWQLAGTHPDQIVAVFSHADAIKAALLHFLGAPADNIVRMDIQPASISVVRLSEVGPMVLSVNLT